MIDNKTIKKLFKLLETIKCALVNAQEQPQIESLSPIQYCDINGTTGFIAYTLDEESGTVNPIYFDSAGLPTTIAPLGAPCEEKEDFEFKFFEKEKCLSDGSTVTEVLCIPFIDGVEQPVSTFWIVNGLKVITEPIGIQDCSCESTPLGLLTNWG